MGIVRRRGLGNIRQLEVTDLWVQAQVRSNNLDIQKIAGTNTIADAFTTNRSKPLLVKHMSAMDVYPEQGACCRGTTADDMTRCGARRGAEDAGALPSTYATTFVVTLASDIDIGNASVLVYTSCATPLGMASSLISTVHSV